MYRLTCLDVSHVALADEPQIGHVYLLGVDEFTQNVLPLLESGLVRVRPWGHWHLLLFYFTASSRGGGNSMLFLFTNHCVFTKEVFYVNCKLISN